MPDKAFGRRVWITAGILLGALALLQGVSHGERVAPHRPLGQMPLVLGDWQGEEWPLDQRILEALGVDDYLNRVYTEAGKPPVALYLGYYGSQQTGDTIHSPKNCLPGAGWEPSRSGRLVIPLPGRPPIIVNEYLVEKGLDRRIVLYWYQSHGRVVASEYSAKVWLVLDAIARNRTDGALVRIVTTVHDGEEQARARAAEFVQVLYPRLNQFVPD